MRSKVLFFLSLFLFVFIFLVPRPASALTTTEKLITVDTGAQRLTAWNNGQIVFQTIVSTGLWQTPTVKGDFRIYAKLPVQNMRGYSRVHGWYYLPNVPYVMYFYQGYGFHGTYWHNNFGTRMSNGCVNMRTADAKWLYEFADIGTRVLIW